ncbi:MAG: hypothetical protein M0P69_16435, partial [Bacteroidales bacterium]|nr:hypothetical protein [Bacteroidales bacterium]
GPKEIEAFSDKVKSSLENLAPSGASSGNAIGKGIHDGIVSWTEKAVAAAQAKIATLKVPGISPVGSGSITDSIATAGRGM